MRGEELAPAYRGHQGVQHTHSEGRPTGEGLSEIELSVRIIVVVLVQELDVAVVDQHGDHRYTCAVLRSCKGRSRSDREHILPAEISVPITLGLPWLSPRLFSTSVESEATEERG